MKKEIDVAIVGAGLAGLGCAARLAREGLTVQVLERSSRLGGRAQSPPVGGIPMNLGAHALYLGGPGERWLAALGIAWTGFQPRPSDTWLVDGADVFQSPSSLFGLLGCRQLSLGERMGLLRFLGTVHRMKPADLAGLSAQGWLDQIAPGPRARRFLEMLIRLVTYSNAPDLLPAVNALHQLQTTVGLRAKGVVYVNGGWQTLLDRMAEAARDAGATIENDAAIEHVAEDGQIILRDGGTIVPRSVIVALPYASARAICPMLETRSLRTPAYAACLDLVLESEPSRRLLLGLDEPYYFSVHSPTSVLASGPIRAHALRYLAPGELGIDWQRPLEQWIARAIPDALSKVVARRFLPEMEVTSALPHLDQDPLPAAIGPIGFAGDWCAPGHLLFDAVAASSEAAVTHARAVAKGRVAA